MLTVGKGGLKAKAHDAISRSAAKKVVANPSQYYKISIPKYKIKSKEERTIGGGRLMITGDSSCCSQAMTMKPLEI